MFDGHIIDGHVVEFKTTNSTVVQPELTLNLGGYYSGHLWLNLYELPKPKKAEEAKPKDDDMFF